VNFVNARSLAASSEVFCGGEFDKLDCFHDRVLVGCYCRLTRKEIREKMNNVYNFFQLFSFSYILYSIKRAFC
jgi:hypothetical protein